MLDVFPLELPRTLIVVQSAGDIQAGLARHGNMLSKSAGLSNRKHPENQRPQLSLHQ